MDDLNDLFYYAQVVEHRGFTRASEASGIPKSRLSRRVAALERRLGVQLIRRSTHGFSVTQIGAEYQTYCLQVLERAEAAQRYIARMHDHPSGPVRISCPVGLLHFRVAEVVAALMVQHPSIHVSLEVGSRHVNVIEEGIDIALRVRFRPPADSGLIVRLLARDAQHLVVSPALCHDAAAIQTPDDLGRLPSVGFGSPAPKAWDMLSPDNTFVRIPHQPRLVTDDLTMLRAATLAGVGVALLPNLAVKGDLASGRLRIVLPQWKARPGLIQAVLATHRGLTPAVRVVVDALSDAFREDGFH